MKETAAVKVRSLQRQRRGGCAKQVRLAHLASSWELPAARPPTHQPGLPVGMREAQRHRDATVQPCAKLASHIIGTRVSKQCNTWPVVCCCRRRSGGAWCCGSLKLAAGS